jgi:Peptidase family S41
VKISFATLLVLLISNARAVTAASPWAAMAQRDLQAIHDTIRDNHPGPVDPENPRFRDWLENGLRIALQEAARARTYSDYTRALRRYATGFQDGHVSLSFGIASTRIDWPGFVVGGDPDGRAAIAYAEPDAGVKRGDHIESCDGVSFDALMKERVDLYFWNSAIPQARMSVAMYLFLANSDERARRLARCRFSSGEVLLKWRTGDATEVNKTLGTALSGGDAEFEMKPLDGVWFIRLPRFWFKFDAETAKLSALISDLTSKSAELRKSTVVFDVRGNGGGDSLWGHRLAVALWGEPWVNRVEESFDSTHDVRVSAANVEKVAALLESAKKNQTEAVPYWTLVMNALRSAEAAGQPLARVSLPPAVLAEPPPPNPISGRVFLLTDPGCGSACLDFADLLLRLPGVTQVGLPTFADAVYIDVNDAELPSGLATLSYGMKVFRHRARANNQWYEPKYRWPGGPMTYEALARWLRALP